MIIQRKLTPSKLSVGKPYEIDKTVYEITNKNEKWACDKRRLDVQDAHFLESAQLWKVGVRVSFTASHGKWIILDKLRLPPLKSVADPENMNFFRKFNIQIF